MKVTICLLIGLIFGLASALGPAPGVYQSECLGFNLPNSPKAYVLITAKFGADEVDMIYDTYAVEDCPRFSQLSSVLFSGPYSIGGILI